MLDLHLTNDSRPKHSLTDRAIVLAKGEQLLGWIRKCLLSILTLSAWLIMKPALSWAYFCGILIFHFAARPATGSVNYVYMAHGRKSHCRFRLRGRPEIPDTRVKLSDAMIILFCSTAASLKLIFSTHQRHFSFAMRVPILTSSRKRDTIKTYHRIKLLYFLVHYLRGA